LEKDGDNAALLAFAEVALGEKHQFSTANFQSAMLGLTAYKANDPVVFSVTGAYRFNKTRKDGSTAFRPGNITVLSPAVI